VLSGKNPLLIALALGLMAGLIALVRAGAGAVLQAPKIQAGRTCDPGRAAPARAGARRSGDTSVQACTDLLPPRVLPP